MCVCVCALCECIIFKKKYNLTVTNKLYILDMTSPHLAIVLLIIFLIAAALANVGNCCQGIELHIF